jgi:hypothetical protein
LRLSRRMLSVLSDWLVQRLVKVASGRLPLAWR